MRRHGMSRSNRPLVLSFLMLGAASQAGAQEIGGVLAPIPDTQLIENLIEKSRSFREKADRLRAESANLRGASRDPEILRRNMLDLREQTSELSQIGETVQQAEEKLRRRLNENDLQQNQAESERLRAESEKLHKESEQLNAVRESLPQESEALTTRASELQLLLDSGQISDPGERTLAFDRAARAMLSGTSPDALEAIRLGREAALRIANPTVRDVRIDNLSETAVAVAQSFQLAALAPRMRDPLQEESPAASDQPLRHLQSAREAFELATDLAARITKEDFRCNRLSQVTNYLGKLSAAAANSARDLPADDDIQPESGSPSSKLVLNREADRFLVQAFEAAQRIPYPHWMNRALVDLVTQASESGQFERSEQIADRIALPRARVESFVELAEAQVKLGKSDDATLSYQKALDSLMSIQIPSIRETFGLILFDSLLNGRRFDDARAVTGIIQNPELKRNALNLVATSMGEAGLDRSANQWIDQTVFDPALRDQLKRRVIDGYSRYVQERRAKSSEGGLPGRQDFGADRGEDAGNGAVPRDELRRSAEDILR